MGRRPTLFACRAAGRRSVTGWVAYAASPDEAIPRFNAILALRSRSARVTPRRRAVTSRNQRSLVLRYRHRTGPSWLPRGGFPSAEPAD